MMKFKLFAFIDLFICLFICILYHSIFPSQAEGEEAEGGGGMGRAVPGTAFVKRLRRLTQDDKGSQSLSHR